jgi:hypothetical protein
VLQQERFSISYGVPIDPAVRVLIMQSFSNPCTMALASGDSTYVSWTQNIIRLMSSFMPLVPPPQLSMAWLSVPSFTMTFLSMARMLVSREIPDVTVDDSNPC